MRVGKKRQRENEKKREIGRIHGLFAQNSHCIVAKEEHFSDFPLFPIHCLPFVVTLVNFGQLKKPLLQLHHSSVPPLLIVTSTPFTIAQGNSFYLFLGHVLEVAGKYFQSRHIAGSGSVLLLTNNKLPHLDKGK